jgi:hypothetical protein
MKAQEAIEGERIAKRRPAAAVVKRRPAAVVQLQAEVCSKKLSLLLLEGAKGSPILDMRCGPLYLLIIID